MKKIGSMLCLLLVGCLCLSACRIASEDKLIAPGTASTTAARTTAEGTVYHWEKQLDYEAQAIRADSLMDMDVTYSSSNAVLLSSASAVEDYCISCKPDFYESSRHAKLLQACEKYDDRYFETKILLVVEIYAGSSSYTHTVDGVGQLEGSEKYTVVIHTTYPEYSNAEVAYWQLLIELDKDAGITSADQIEVVRD